MEMKDADIENKNRINNKFAALIVKILYENAGIHPEEDLESDEEGDDAEEVEEEAKEGVDEEGIALKSDNPFSFIKEIKLGKG